MVNICFPPSFNAKIKEKGTVNFSNVFIKNHNELKRKRVFQIKLAVAHLFSFVILLDLSVN